MKMEDVAILARGLGEELEADVVAIIVWRPKRGASVAAYGRPATAQSLPDALRRLADSMEKKEPTIFVEE